MIEHHVSLDALPETIRRQAGLAPRAARAACRRAARRGEAMMTVRSASFADLGIFTNAWGVIDEDDGATLLNDAPHAAPLEEGRRAAFPPVLPIFEYLGRKEGIPTAGVAQGEKWDLSDQPAFKGYTDLPEAEAPPIELLRRHAVALSRWLGTHDLPGKHLMTNALPEFNEATRREMERGLRDAEREVY